MRKAKSVMHLGTPDSPNDASSCPPTPTRNHPPVSMTQRNSTSTNCLPTIKRSASPPKTLDVYRSHSTSTESEETLPEGKEFYKVFKVG